MSIALCQQCCHEDIHSLGRENSKNNDSILHTEDRCLVCAVQLLSCQAFLKALAQNVYDIAIINQRFLPSTCQFNGLLLLDQVQRLLVVVTLIVTFTT